MTIRMTPHTRAAIEKEAEKHDWAPSKMAEKILSAWAEEQTKLNEDTKCIVESET